MDDISCCTCGNRKSVSEFHRNKSTKTGYAKNCKVCARAAHKKYRDSAKGTATKTAYRETETGQKARKKAVDRYNASDARYNNSIKYRRSAKGVATMALRRHERQAAVSTGDKVDLLAMYESDNMKCHYCGISLTHGHETYMPTHDHIVPISKGGSHTLSNLVTSCRACNCAKKDIEYHTFIKKQNGV